MRRIVIAALAVTVTLYSQPAPAADDPSSLPERLKEAAREAGDALRRGADAVAQGASQAWDKTQAYLSDDPATYREGARRGLDNTMHYLEGHLDLARAELRDLVGTPSR
jgi:hypothetical protein